MHVYTQMYLHVIACAYIVYSFHSSRVEGEGKAKITDVIFNASTVTKGGPQEEDGSSKREHEKMVEEIIERQKELKHLQLKEEVLKKEKELLSTLASHASKVQSVKVGRLAILHLKHDKATLQKLKCFCNVF